MFAFVLLAVLSAAAAAPHYFDHEGGYAAMTSYRHHSPSMQMPNFENFGESIFDTRRFWADLAQEMNQLNSMIEDFYTKFPTLSSEQDIHGNEYKVTISLSGFDEKDIVVKAKEGVLMVQAIHNHENGGQSTYMDIKTLPDCVNVHGSWTYEHGVLKIVFPLKKQTAETETDISVEHTTVTPSFNEDKSREDMETHSGKVDEDADVGLTNLSRGELTNEIPRGVEATTYPVDFNNEVEFVPVRY